MVSGVASTDFEAMFEKALVVLHMCLYKGIRAGSVKLEVALA